MKACQDLILKLKRFLPDLLTSKDLVSLGVYKTAQAAYMARIKGKCPPFMKIPFRGVVYPKDGVIEFLERNSHDFP